MTAHVDLREFVGAFVAEADEIIETSNALLLEIERANAVGESRPRAVRDLYRALHTIKGLAGMIGVESIVEIAHGLESLLRTADRAGGGLRPAATDVCLQAIAEIGLRVRAVADDRQAAVAPPALLERIAVIEAGNDVVVPPPPAATAWTGVLGPSERKLSVASNAVQHPSYCHDMPLGCMCC